MAQLIQVRLSRHDAQPWGFRLSGGKDFGTPLVVQKVAGGSLADKAGLIPGDAVVKVNDYDVFNLRHKDAQDIIVRSGNCFDLTLQRGGSTWRPHVQSTGSLPTPSSQLGHVAPVTRTSLAHKPQEVRHIGSGYNNAARPYGGINGTDGHVKSIVNKQYNSPVGIYSEEAIAETLSAQAEVLAGGVLGVNFKKNEKIYNAANSEVLKMLHEQENDPEPDEQDPYQSTLQHSPRPRYEQEQQHYHTNPTVTKHVTAPVARPNVPNTGGLPAGQNICTECERLIVDPQAPCNYFWTASHAIGGNRSPIPRSPATVRSEEHVATSSSLKQTSSTIASSSTTEQYQQQEHLQTQSSDTLQTSGVSTTPAGVKGPQCGDCGTTIVGVFVRVKDKNLHVDCFKCATCGTSLKNQGYFNFNNKLYCDIHAKMAAMKNPPPGTDGYVPVPIKANQKLSASTISAALDAVGVHANGTAPPSHNENGVIVEQPLQLSHSRTSSSSSSSAGTANSYISSISPNKSLSPEKLSPAHSRQSSESGIGSGCIVSNNYNNNNSNSNSNNSSNSNSLSNSIIIQTSNPSAATLMYNKNDTSINHKQNENDMNTSNRKLDDMTISAIDGCSSIGGQQQQQQQHSSMEYNDFLKEYYNPPISSLYDINTDVGYKSSLPDVNDNGYNTMTTPSILNRNGYNDAPTQESIYGTIRPNAKVQPHEEFQYITLDGSVIKSVIPPGKGIKTNYKVHSGYGGPKPFNAGGPMSPQSAGPRSPSSYPPPAPNQAPSWAQPKPAPKPAVNPYATLPRTGEEQSAHYYESQRLEEQHEEHMYAEDIEVSDANRTKASTFHWPPPVEDDGRCTPTASPLYIAPPETQHVHPKPLSEKQREQTQQQQQAQQALEVAQQQQQQQQQTCQWQSRSAPELSGKQHVEIESSSDSYTSTCTTTTTTSEEYQRMYQAQVQAYQMQQMYDQSGSEIDYHMDMEVAAMQQQQEHSYSSAMDFFSSHSGRRSAQECAAAITGPISTYHLVDMVREVTPKPETPTPKGPGPRKVEFADDVTEKTEKTKEETKEKKTEEREESERKKSVGEEELKVVRPAEDKSAQRQFAPTPEIVIDIPETKQVPPSNIPNPVPKEWISPMVKALTTAPDKPVTLPDVSGECEKPCDSKECEKVCAKAQKKSGEKKEEAEVLREPPPKGSFMTSVLATAPTEPVKFASTTSEPVPLPEETEPYMPPPIDMKPYMREDFRPKSPLLNALMTAPEEPLKPFGHDVCSQLLDLPTPKERLTMKDALTVAPDRAFTPLNFEKPQIVEPKEEKKPAAKPYVFFDEQQQRECESIESQMCRQLSAFSGVQDYRSLSQQSERKDSLAPKVPRNSIVSISQSPAIDSNDQEVAQTFSHRASLAQTTTEQQSSTSAGSYQTYARYASQQRQQQQIHEQTSHQLASYRQQEQQQQQQQQQTIASTSYHQSMTSSQSQTHHQTASPMPRKQLLLSGLHKPEQIPKYQKNWTVLPSQRPVKTPEPPELKENVPLAFVDVPKERSPSVQRPVAVQSASSNHGSTASDATRISESKPKPPPANVPVIVEEYVGPKETHFQSIDVQPKEDHSHMHPRPYTPSLINKPAPIVPFYQEEEKLVFTECEPRVSHEYDPRSPSPCPDRAKSPAPGPPPNPLSAIRAPRIKEMDYGSITTGQSYLSSQKTQQQQQYQAQVQQQQLQHYQQSHQQQLQQQQQQGNVLSHYESLRQAETQRLIDKPEVVKQQQFADLSIQRREKESHLSEEKRSDLQSKTTTQVGNTQIERRRRVVEEYEHTQSARTIEIQKSSGGQTQMQIQSKQQVQAQQQQQQQQQHQRQTQQIQQSQQIQQKQQSQQQTQQEQQQQQQQQKPKIGRTGFVASQARRLSELEQEISSVSSQSQAISARAASLGAGHREAKFPQYKSPEPVSKFPIKNVLPSHDEPQRPAYIISPGTSNQLVDPPGYYERTHPKVQEFRSHAATSSTLRATSSTAQSSIISATSAASSSLSSHAYASATQNLLTATTATTSSSSSSTLAATSSTITAQQNAASGSRFYETNASVLSALPVPALKTPSEYASGAACNLSDQTNICCQQQQKQLTSSCQSACQAAAATAAQSTGSAGYNKPHQPQAQTQLQSKPSNTNPNVNVSDPSPASAGPSGPSKGGAFGATSAPKRGRGILNKAVGPGVRVPLCGCCNTQIRGPFITALGRIWCPDHFICVNANCRRALQDIGFVEEKGDLYCEYCFEKYLAPTCSKCSSKIKGDCLNAIGRHFHPECFTCAYCGKLFGNSPFFLEEGEPYCEADWNELFTTKCFACGFPVEAGDKWVEALNHNYHSQCFNCTYCKKNLEGQSFYNKGGRPFCKNHAR